jgi:hypothetical protein
MDLDLEHDPTKEALSKDLDDGWECQSAKIREGFRLQHST